MANAQNNGIFLVDQTITQNALSLPTITVDSTPIYPSTYWARFVQGAERRPRVDYWNQAANIAYHHLAAMLDGNIWNDKTVCTFMVAVIRENAVRFQATPVNAWVSEDVNIIAAGISGTPLNILNLHTPADGAPAAIQGEPIPSDQPTRLRLFWCLVMLYRKALANAQDPTYGTTVTTRLNNFFKTGVYGVTQEQINTIAPFVHQDKLTEGYLKIIAALDMFFWKFQTHEFSSCRIATLSSRYKGCSALTSLGFIASKMGLTTRLLSLYILTRPVAKELAQIAKEGESLEDVDGYFPYQVDMGLTNKSPYSLNANPTLYLWIHTIGSVLNLQRSLMAVLPQGSQDLSGTITSAAAVALHLTSSFSFKRQIALTAADATGIRERNAAIAARAAEVIPAAPVENQAPDDAGRNPLPPMPQEADENARQANRILENIIANEGLTPHEKLELTRKMALARGYRGTSVGRYLSGFWA
ncbi:NP [Xinjiang tick rhabdovirus]|uniref:Nucleoprotein n=1 Tax=Xinjiang tick rhabdovirus TaxID=2560016 RepID=A0A482M0A6_9RHAB|nr:NP [Xinjiang tick rhabdovirus]QBQ65042.1 NP [Xinjiang tick rhabdovirus]